MIEKLKKFCGDPRYNGRIGTPWSAGEFTFATNGFTLIRLPRIPEVPERENVVNVKAVLDLNPEPVDGYVDAPGIDGLKIPECPRCKGKQSDPKECRECDGDGIVYLESDFHNYECECKTCDGEGVVGGCRKCHGTGYLIDPEDDVIEIAGAEFKKVNILNLIREFGPLHVAPPSPIGKASWIRFSGGHALLMPITRANGA